MAYINREQINSAGVGAKPWIPVNRWSNSGDYSIFANVTGTATYTLEVTLDQLNRMTPAEIANAKVCPVVEATDQTTDGCFNITSTPLEFIRVNQTAGTGSVDIHIQQNGSYK